MPPLHQLSKSGKEQRARGLEDVCVPQDLLRLIYTFLVELQFSRVNATSSTSSTHIDAGKRG